MASAPGGLKLVCVPQPPRGTGEDGSAGVGQEGLTPRIPGGSQGSDPSPSKAPMEEERLGGPL